MTLMCVIASVSAEASAPKKVASAKQAAENGLMSRSLDFSKWRRFAESESSRYRVVVDRDSAQGELSSVNDAEASS
jgi:hypothetical protein